MSVVESIRIQVLKNQYEGLIEQMIMDDIPWMTPELRMRIENAPAENRREMIISIMEENNPEHRLMFSEIRKMMSNPDRSEMTHIKEVVQMLRKYVKVSPTDIEKHGEVMTPIDLVEEMLDTLNTTNVWTNPNLKWLDPCNGVGPFISVVIERLMKGLQTWEPDDEKRYKHIMENMIYVCEIQSKNMFLYLYAFDPEDKYSLNIYCDSYLSDGFNKYMKDAMVDKFDIIVMNPPYNDTTGKSGFSHTLWDKFVFKSDDILNPGGYIVAVHPAGWRNVDGNFKDVQKLLKTKQILYLEVHSADDGLKTFGSATRYDFYCLHNVPYQINTIIKTQNGNIGRVDISKLEFIPNGGFKEIRDLLAKNGEERVKLIYGNEYYYNKPHMCGTKNIFTEEFKYPCVEHISSKKNSTEENIPTAIHYSNINTLGHFGIPKVIFTRRHSGVFLDINGEYGMTSHGFGIVDDPDKLKYIQKALLNPKFIELSKLCDVGGCGDTYNHRVLESFRKDFWTDFI